MTLEQTYSNTQRHRRAVGVFPSRQAAEQALHELRDSGFAMDRVSVIARDAKHGDHMAGAEVHDRDNLADEGAKVGALSGGALGGLTGLLVGLGALAIPGIGPVMLAGATATTLATTLAGGAIGAVTGGLLGALIGLGIPEDRARVYNDRVARGDFLVMVEGTETDIARAEHILHHRGIEDYGVYDMPDQPTRSGHSIHAEQPIRSEHQTYAEPLHDQGDTAPTPTTGMSPQPIHIGTSTPLPLGASSSSDQPRGDRYGQRQATGFFTNRQDAEDAVDELRQSGFPLRQVSLVAENVERSGTFAELDTHQHLDEHRFGFLRDRISFLNSRLVRGDYLLVVHGTHDEIERAANILNRRGIQEFNLYDAQTPARDDVQLHRSANFVTETVHPAGIAVGRQRTLAHRRAVGTFDHHHDAEAALQQLRDSGFSMDRVSVIAKDAHRGDSIAGAGLSPSANKADEGAKAGAVTGGALGGLGGLLVGLGALAIPGVGPVVLGGAAATALATTLSGGAIGAAAGGLVGGLVGLGIPEDRARLYNDRFEHGDYLVIVDGTDEELHRAESVLNRQGLRNWGVFDSADAHTPRRTPMA